MNTNLSSQETKQQSQAATSVSPAADAPSAATTPEQLVDQLRAVRQQFGDLPVLTVQQRANFRSLIRDTESSVQTSINVIGSSGTLTQAVGQPADQIRDKVTESNRWTNVEDELRSMLQGIADANLARRHEIALLTAQAYVIGQQLARKPENGELKAHLKEIKRLRGLARRKKGASTSQTPSPSVPSTTSSSTPEAPSAPAMTSAKPQS